MAVVADGDHAAGVDAVASDSEVDVDGGFGRGGFGSGGVGLGGGSAAEGSMGADGVVVAQEPVELALQGCQVGCGGLGTEPLLHGLMEAFYFALGLWLSLIHI